MIRHIVLFKLIDSLSPEKKSEQLLVLKSAFEPLRDKLAYIKEYRTGINFNMSEHSWDFVIDSVFVNKDDLNRYHTSAEHLEAIKNGSSVPKTKAVVDYEF